MLHWHIHIGDVRYQLLRDGNPAAETVLSSINEYIRNTQNVSFTATFAVVAEWRAVRPFDQQQFNSFPSMFEEDSIEVLNSVRVKMIWIHSLLDANYTCI